MNFKTWFEGRDIFGFDNEPQEPNRKVIHDDPVHRFDIELFTSYLAEMTLEGKESFIKFANEVHWGRGPGAIRVWTGTGLSVAVEQLNMDLQGNPTWLMKKFYQINREGFGGYEETVASELFEQIKKINETGALERPDNAYKDLENLVVSMANKIRRTAKPYFIFEGVRKVNDNNYIIKLGLTGHGVETQDQQRVIENLTDVSYDPRTGKIRVINANVENHCGRNVKWEIMPSDEDFYFFPTQSRDEIIEACSVILRWY